jgi:hypothetical protein
MKILKFIAPAIIIIALVFNLSLAADNGWKKIGEEEGIVGYTRPTNKSTVDEIKAEGIVNAPIAVVEAVMRDVPSMPEYMFLCKEASLVNTPDMKSAGDVVYFYSLTDLPFPVNDRDGVIKSVWSIDKATGTIYCHAEGVKTTYKQKNNTVRVTFSIIETTLIPRGADKTYVIYQVLSNPGGSLPSFVVNLLTNDYGIKTIAGLRKMVKKDKFKNAKTVITTTAKTKN